MWGALQQFSRPLNTSLSNKRVSIGECQHGAFTLRRRCDQFRVYSRGAGESETDSRTKAVAKTLLQKEEELKFITAPGRLPPRASVVGSLRKEIAQLRLELADPEKYKFSAPLVSAPSAQNSHVNLTSTGDKRKKASPLQAKSSIGSGAKKASSAKAALLMVEKQLSLGDEKPMVPPRQVSDKVRDALVMVEKNMTIGEASLKNSLTDLETLQVENALLRTRLEVTLEKKRHVMQLHSTWLRRQEFEREQPSLVPNGSSASKQQILSGSASKESGQPSVASLERAIAL